MEQVFLDERLVLPLFMPFIDQGEIANLPAYSYYVRISAVNAQEPMSGMTIVVEENGSESMAERVLKSSRELYAKKIEEVAEAEEAKLEQKPVRKPSAAREQKKNHATKKASDELSEMKPVA